jgi:uncharacterized protein (DUF433 family)
MKNRVSNSTKKFESSKKVDSGKSQVVSIRLTVQQFERLQRVSSQFGHTASEAAAVMIEEGLRKTEFAFIDFRSSIRGREAFLQTTGLAIWEIVMIGRGYKMNVDAIADHLQLPDVRIEAALNYYAAYPEDIQLALDDLASYDFEKLKRMLPDITVFSVSLGRSIVAEDATSYTGENTGSSAKPAKKQSKKSSKS